MPEACGPCIIEDARERLVPGLDEAIDYLDWCAGSEATTTVSRILNAILSIEQATAYSDRTIVTMVEDALRTLRNPRKHSR